MSSCTTRTSKLLGWINTALLLFGIAFLIFSFYLIHAHSYETSWGASSLIVSGSTLFVFSLGYAFGGKKYPQFLVFYGTVMLFVLLSQLAFLSVWSKKEERGQEWTFIKKKGPAIINLIESQDLLFRRLMSTLISLEAAAVILSFLLSRYVHPESFEANYMPNYESLNAEEEQDLLSRNRRREDFKRAQIRRKEKIQKLREMREKFDDQL